MLQSRLLLTLFISSVFLVGHVQAKLQLRLRLQQRSRLNPSVLGKVAGDVADQGPDLSVQGLDQANEEMQEADKVPPKFDQGYVPESPPHGPDVSPGDPFEVIDDAMGDHAEVWRPEPPGMPRPFKASTCANACSKCKIVADEIQGCKCKATCIRGADSSKCLTKHIGWTHDEKTQPKEQWEGKCNNGHVDCSECRDEELEKEADRCHGDPMCLHNLRTAMAKPDPERFCLNKKFSLSECERFTHLPKDNDWKCFPTREECERTHYLEEGMPIESTFGTQNTPCMWCATVNAPDPDKQT